MFNLTIKGSIDKKLEKDTRIKHVHTGVPKLELYFLCYYMLIEKQIPSLGL